ncbi:MAG TPA: ribonuclease Z [Thermoanaerobaculia bacterium]|nr:ribonuclease Z [Thermoanaerobaculia bacterium]
MDQIRVVFLGTGAGTPSRERNVASLAIVLDGRVLLFDCGEGTQHQLLRSSVRNGRIEAIFITHLHGDHLYGLPGLLASLSLNGRTEPLTVYGPGVAAFVSAVRETSRLRLAYELSVLDVASGEVMRGDGFRVIAAPLEHTIECFGYCVIEDDRPGEFDVARANELRIPAGPLYGRLQSGEDVEFGGRMIRSAEVLGAPRRGRRIAYCTDTRPARASVELARGADLLIHEATYGSDVADEARKRGHSTASEAAEVAREAGAVRLILTHFSPRYEDVAPLIDEARDIASNVDGAYDLAEVPCPRNDRNL